MSCSELVTDECRTSPVMRSEGSQGMPRLSRWPVGHVIHAFTIMAHAPVEESKASITAMASPCGDTGLEKVCV